MRNSTRWSRALLTATLVVGGSTTLAAQRDSTQRPAAPPPPVGPPVRRIATAQALSTEDLGAVSSVLELADGHVLVNDGTRRRLLLMDTTLKTVQVVLDSLAEVANTYGTRPGTLIPYRADSVLFVDPVSYAVLVLDPAARIARVRSIWRVQDTYLFTNPGAYYGWPSVDAKGRIIYRVPAQPAPPKVAPPPGVPYFPPDPDSAFIAGIDLDSRKLDTLGVIRIPKNIYQIKQTAEGYFSITSTVNPLPSTDDWAVLPNGTIAFVRGRDYRIEYLHPDGTWSSSQKLPYDWQRLGDEDKQKVVDSVKEVNTRQQMSGYVAQMIRWANVYNKPYPSTFKVPDSFTPQQGLMKDWRFPPGMKFPANYIYGCPPGVEPTMTPLPGAATETAAKPGDAKSTDAKPGEAKAGEAKAVETAARGAAPAAPPAGMPALPQGMNFGPPGSPAGIPSCIPQPIMISGGIAPPPPQMREFNVIPALELPDYRPPIAPGATRADADGNLWIRPIPPKPVPGGPVYDIVNDKGELSDRLQLPPGYTLVGFGKGKVVYLSMRDAKGIHLARVRLR
jgi:hypothetical protein